MTMNRLARTVFTSTVVVSGLMLGCAQETAEEVDTEEAALKDPTTGEPTCAGKKVLVCHVPPGNPGNAHEICVGAPAVAAHVANHGDPIGPCAPPSPPPDVDAGAPTPDGGEDTGTPPNDGVVIR